MKPPGNKVVVSGILLLGAISVFLFCTATNRRLWAHWNLLVEGRPFCRLVDRRSASEVPPEYQNVNIRWLVYQRGRCVGYTDQFGDLIDASSPGSLKKTQTNLAVLYTALRFSVSALFLWCIANLAMRV